MVLYKLKGMKKVLKEKQLDYLERFIRVNMIDSVPMEVDSVKVVTENDSLVVYLYLVQRLEKSFSLIYSYSNFILKNFAQSPAYLFVITYFLDR